MEFPPRKSRLIHCGQMHRKTSLLGRSFFKKRRFPQKLISTFKTLSERSQRDCPSVRGGQALILNAFFVLPMCNLGDFFSGAKPLIFEKLVLAKSRIFRNLPFGTVPRSMSGRLQSKLLRIVNACNLFSYTPVAHPARLRFWSGF